MGIFAMTDQHGFQRVCCFTFKLLTASFLTRAAITSVVADSGFD